MSDDRHLGDSIFGGGAGRGPAHPQSPTDIGNTEQDRETVPAASGHDSALDANGDSAAGSVHEEHSFLGGSTAAGAAPPPSGGRRKKRGAFRVVVYLLALALVVAGGAAAYAGLRPMYDRFTAPKDYAGPGSGSVTITVNAGDSGRDIGATLAKAGVVLTADAFADAVNAQPGDDVQPGNYTLKKQMSAAQALSALRQGARNVDRVTVREGLWKSEVFAALAKATGRKVSDYQAAEKSIKANPSLVGLPVSAKGNLEGYLFPATYSFDPGTDAVTQLRELVKKSVAQLNSLGVSPKNMEHIVTIASIVEAEARLDSDRPKVAQVITNRLRIKMPLQLDSTVSYGVQRRSITTTDKERADKNGYNTYVHAGLPAGPIGNPGAESITAAQKPAAGSWIFFVTVDPNTGKTLFASTIAEHNANVAVFQKWCQSNPGKC